MTLQRHIDSLQATARLGAELAGALAAAARSQPVLVTFRGSLGAGKTTLIRAIIHGLGFEGNVPSPTYTLHEPYEVAGLAVHHLDLYRLQDAGELELIGVRDILDRAGVCLVEWPERGAGVLPDPDLEVEIEAAADHRRVRVAASSETGADLLAALQ